MSYYESAYWTEATCRHCNRIFEGRGDTCEDCTEKRLSGYQPCQHCGQLVEHPDFFAYLHAARLAKRDARQLIAA